jgi:hypothetical protein
MTRAQNLVGATRALACAAIGAASLFATPARADTQTSTRAAQAAAAALAAPTPSPASLPAVAAQAAKAVLGAVRVYGVVNARVVASSGAVDTFSQPNAGAITAAGDPVLSNVPGDARLTFQAAQSRFGVWVGEGSPLRAHLQLDFIDFTKASVTVQAVPRLRIATLEYNPTPALTITAGQDWDLVQPLNPHGINMVGAAFQAGNTGFMRQQLRAFYELDALELALALGLQNNNATAKDGAVELDFVPTFAARAQYTLGKHGRIGVSALGTAVLFNPGPNAIRTFAGLGGAYANLRLGSLDLRVEAYAAQNAANLFLLGLSQGRAVAVAGQTGAVEARDLREVGGFASAKVDLVDARLAGYATLGGAAILNPDDVVPSYGYAGTIDPANPPALSTATLAGAGPGMKWNLTGRVGLELKLLEGFSLLAEGFWHRSFFALAAVDQGRVKGVAQALGVETGFLYTF